jgi:Terminase large subunit, T4likevirus-type, N-terminal
MTDTFPIDRALVDQRLLGAALGDASSWATWVVVLKAAFGLALSEQEQRAFVDVAGNRGPPTKRVRELWAVVGRRGGKSRIAAALAAFFATFVQYQLAAGEKGLVLVLAASQAQARVVFDYCLGFLTQSPVLKQEIASTTKNEIRLRNGITIAIHSNSFRTIRGRTLCACIFDEVSYWRDETSATPDAEVYSAVLPALLTTGGMLVGISTGYRRAGLLYQKHRDYFGIDSADTLIVQGSTQVFNKTIDDVAIAAQRTADPAAAPSEWDGTFRDDISAFLDDQLIESAIEHGRPLELAPLPGTSAYYKAFTDASGGRGDAYSLAIGHKEGENFVIDVVRGTHPPFDPVEVTKQYVALLKQYRIGEVTGDHYAAEWVAGAWRDCGMRYIRSELHKSAIYLEALPLFARGLVRLPDHPRLLRELRLLERHTHRSGKDSVDHGRNGSDDYANACCGVLRNLSNYPGFSWHSGWLDD